MDTGMDSKLAAVPWGKGQGSMKMAQLKRSTKDNSNLDCQDQFQMQGTTGHGVWEF